MFPTTIFLILGDLPGVFRVDFLGRFGLLGVLPGMRFCPALLGVYCLVWCLLGLGFRLVVDRRGCFVEGFEKPKFGHIILDMLREMC
jgi:hypothetical protein